MYLRVYLLLFYKKDESEIWRGQLSFLESACGVTWIACWKNFFVDSEETLNIFEEIIARWVKCVNLNILLWQQYINRKDKVIWTQESNKKIILTEIMRPCYKKNGGSGSWLMWTTGHERVGKKRYRPRWFIYWCTFCLSQQIMKTE